MVDLIAPVHAAISAANDKPGRNKAAEAPAAERRVAQHAAELREAPGPDKLLVRLDESAQRFVQTLTDVTTAETVRRYPSEAQLAYARAVMAYLRARDRA